MRQTHKSWCFCSSNGASIQILWRFQICRAVAIKAPTACSLFYGRQPDREWAGNLQRTYVSGERLDVLGLALAGPALLTSWLRQSVDYVGRGHKDARRNNAPTRVRVRARGVVVGWAELGAVRVGGAHTGWGGIPLPGYAVVGPTGDFC